MSRRRIALLGVPLCLAWIAGCQRNQPVEDNATVARKATPAAGGGASPIENYKQQRMRDAMQGLRYDSGVVTLDIDAAKGLLKDLEGRTFEDLVSEGRADMNSSLHVEAIAAFTRAIILDPTKAEGYEALGDALVTKGRIDESQAAYASARSMDDTSASLRFKVAENHQRKGELEQQIAMLNAVIELDANHAEAHVRLAIAHYYQEDFESARGNLARAEQLGGNVPPQFRALLAQK